MAKEKKINRTYKLSRAMIQDIKDLGEGLSTNDTEIVELGVRMVARKHKGLLSRNKTKDNED